MPFVRTLLPNADGLSHLLVDANILPENDIEVYFCPLFTQLYNDIGASLLSLDWTTHLTRALDRRDHLLVWNFFHTFSHVYAEIYYSLNCWSENATRGFAAILSHRWHLKWNWLRQYHFVWGGNIFLHRERNKKQRFRERKSRARWKSVSDHNWS